METTVAESAPTVQSTPSPTHTQNTEAAPSDTVPIPNGSPKAQTPVEPMEVQSDVPPNHNKPTTSKKPAQPVSEANSPKSSPAKSRSRSRSKKSSQPKVDITIDDSKVEVSGYPAYVKAQDLYKIFSSYGPLQVEHMGRRCAVIAFERVESARAAIDDSMQLCLYGQFLVIKPFTGIVDDQRKQIYKSKHAVETVAPETIPLSGSFAAQAASLLARVRLTQEQVTALATLYHDLERVLQPVWPGCQAMPFGSITTGLGVKSSDADCFVNIPPQYRYNYYNYVNKAKRILLMYPEKFTEVFAIPRANTPIVKLFHLPTKTHCDLTFKTPLGALNSKLVAFLLHADPRFLPLAVLVKYWASVQGISGSGKLTNYALTLMLVFYLQARGLLPPVAALQRDAALIVVDGWNTGFAENYRFPRRPEEPLHDLFGGFFQFYDTFDFENQVACPFLGRPVDKKLFISGDLPHEFHRYRKNVAENLVAPLRIKVSVCVQDPFEQCHNVASSVSPRMFEDMRVYIRFAAEHYEKDKPNGCENLLRNILLDKPKLVRAKTNPEYRVTLYPKMLGTIVHDDWKGAFRRAVLAVFERMLKLKLKLITEKDTPRHNARERERYVTSMSKPVWKRKQFTRMYEAIPLGFVEKQEQITEEILNSDMTMGVIEFQVILSFCTKMRSAWVSIRVTNGDVDEFHNFGKYFIGTMQSWMIRVIHASGDTSGKDDVNQLRALNMADGALGLSDPDSDSDSTDKDDKPRVEPQSALTNALQVPATEPSTDPDEIQQPQPQEVQPTASDC